MMAKYCGVVYPHTDKNGEVIGTLGFELTHSPTWHTATFGGKVNDKYAFIYGAFSDTAEWDMDFDSLLAGVLTINARGGRYGKDYILPVNSIHDYSRVAVRDALKLTPQFFLCCETASEARCLAVQLKGFVKLDDILHTLFK